MHVGCFIFGGGGGVESRPVDEGVGSLQTEGPFITTKWCDFG